MAIKKAEELFNDKNLLNYSMFIDHKTIKIFPDDFIKEANRRNRKMNHQGSLLEVNYKEVINK